jgi:hypothetical protein
MHIAASSGIGGAKADTTHRDVHTPEDMPSLCGIKESLMGTKRPVKVIFMGMGAAGIDVAHAVKHQGPGIDFTIYEKNEDNTIKLPSVKGLQHLKGVKVHSAASDQSLDLMRKRFSSLAQEVQRYRLLPTSLTR